MFDIDKVIELTTDKQTFYSFYKNRKIIEFKIQLSMVLNVIVTKKLEVTKNLGVSRISLAEYLGLYHGI